VNSASLASTVILAAGLLLIRRELRRGRPVSGAALAGDVMALAGSARGTALIAEGPWWPLAFIPALCALSCGVAGAAVLGARRKARRP
jgi:hypothetical protein